MRKKLLSILALSVLVTSTLIGCAQPSEQPCTLNVYSITGGNVSVMDAGTGSWIEAEVGMTLEPGDTIRCSGSSDAEITFIEGTTIDLETGTEIEVASLDYSGDTGSATVRVKQTIGTIIFRVTKLVDPASRYEVETPTGVVAVRGSAVQITVIEDGTTWACNLEGDIWATAQGVELQIPEGRCCVIRPGQPPKLICDLTISSSGGGSVTIPGEGTFTYDEGTVVDLTAEAEEGYQFGGWTGDVGTIDDVNASSTNITMNDIYSITANFEVTPPSQYSLTISGTAGGSVTTPGQGTFAYNANTVVDLVAKAEDGYRFVTWTGDVGTIANVNAASTTITVTDDCSITANFGRIYFMLTVAVNGSGSTSPSVGQHSYAAGTVVPIVATPADGYHFVYWAGDVGTIGAINLSSTTIAMNGDYSIIANFASDAYPSINLEKYVRDNSGTYVDADTAPGPYIPWPPTSNLTIFRFAIANLGNLELTDVYLTDTDMIVFYTDEACTIPATFPTTLALFETKTYYGWLVWASGQQSDTATAVGTPPVGGDVIDNDPAYYFDCYPRLTIEKYVRDSSGTYMDADTAPGPYIPCPAQNYTIFRFTITNSADATLTDVYLTDTDMSVFYTDEACTIPATFPTTLALSETKTYYGMLVWASGQQSDTATAVGTPQVGGDVTDNDPAYYFGS